MCSVLEALRAAAAPARWSQLLSPENIPPEMLSALETKFGPLR
jgi:hypothetical protein